MSKNTHHNRSQVIKCNTKINNLALIESDGVLRDGLISIIYQAVKLNLAFL